MCRPLQCAVQSVQFATTNYLLEYHEWVIPKLQKNQEDYVATVDTISAVLWGLAVEDNLDFTKDPTIIDTTLSLTTDELGKHAMMAVAATNTQALGKLLRDPRFKVASFADDDGNSLLHLALRRCRGANLDRLGVVLLLLDAGCDVSRTNRKGLDPLQSWNWLADDEENLTANELESFDQAAHLLTDHGARCDRQSPENRTALHLHIDQPCRLRALLKHQPAESVKKAMETVDNDGYTPLTLSLWKMHVRSASILLAQHTSITSEMAQSPIMAPSLAVRAGDEHIFDSLMRSGVNSISEGTKTLLHYVGPHTSVQFVRRLKTLYAYAEDYAQRSNGYTPLESYLTSCLEIDGVTNINDLVIDELSISDTPKSEMSKAATWDCFTSRILRNAMQLPISRTGILTDEDEKDDRQLVAKAAGTSLIRLGYLQSFESCLGKSGIIPLMQSFSSSQSLMAAFRGGVSVLTEIHSDIKHGVKKDWHDKMDWRRKCELSSGITNIDIPGQQTVVGPQRLRDKTLARVFRNAIDMDNLALCKSLYADGFDLATPLNDCAGGSLLVEAIDQERIAIAEWILQQGVSVTTAVCDSEPVESAIHLVLANADLVDMLPVSLENYAKNGGMLLGETPNMVSTAVLGNNIEGLRVLLQHAKDNQCYYGSLWSIHPDRVVSALIHEVDISTGWTPLHKAADQGALKAIKTLLESGADINAVDSKFQTPLHIAIASRRDIEEAVALHLIQEGANLERRDFSSKTPAIKAAAFRRTRTLAALVNANVDIHVTEHYLKTTLHYLVREGSVMAFADLIYRGADPYRMDMDGCSAFNQAIKDPSFISFLLNSNLRLEDSAPLPWDCWYENEAAWLTTAYPLFRKRYGLQELGHFANLAPADGQTPLCKAAKRGSVLAVENLLELGAHIDQEGCLSGSALMAACEFGRKDLVKYLVRRGASLSYTGSNGFRSAYESAKGHEEILKWLLVDRFVDQLKLKDDSDGNFDNVKDRGAFLWGGPIKAELVISGQMERLPHESSREYWSWLMKEKVKWRGKTLPPNTRRRTISPSKIVPQETVRIHTQGYNFNGHEGDWFSKKMPKIQSDGECWYVSYIDTP
ncbi:ankyrin isoform [Colletotrichum kahawae]|uniref:Ankyrin isoform n=1 Tax=Colletotrichum kahawae TaxID=34407 RepID=A0AAD9YG81_COLKA|nr:ankyrin isoform [Colletotrichum kahawae]